MLVMLIPSMVKAQRNADIGVFAGTAYYMGDINPNRHFYRPSLSFGFLYRYNINARYAVRANAYVVDLSGNDLDFPERLNPDRPLNPQRFQTSLLDLALQAEFNFLSYTPSGVNWEYSPYITAGLAGSMIMGSDVDATNTLTIPFGIGVKVNLTSRLSGGAEWGFRKTFSDALDGVENPSGTSSLIHNNDWYSIIGIFITYKFFNFATECPAYD
jgi:hypothetical protein